MYGVNDLTVVFAWIFDRSVGLGKVVIEVHYQQ
jgi:hypothetical protein